MEDKGTVPKRERKRGKRRAADTYGRLRRWLKKKWKRHGSISVEDVRKSRIRDRKLPFPLKWDAWSAIYCDPKHAKTRYFNNRYFFMTLTMCIAQGTYFQLATLMQKHGGFAFLIVLLLSYIAVGYPFLIIETMVGQYSSRKPLRLLRYMCPALSGIAPAWYARTLALAMNSLATFMYSVYFSWDLFFCTPWENSILHLVIHAEKKQTEYVAFKSLFQKKLDSQSYDLRGQIDFSLWVCAILLIFVLTLMTSIHTIGSVLDKTVKIFYLGLLGYLIIVCLRVGVEPDGSRRMFDTVTFLPIRMLIRTNWSKLFSGNAWVDAIYHVMRSLALGTLIHPYLGSKSFFHYRTHRDGIWLIILTIIWNATFAVAALIWLGYVGVNPEQIKLAMQQLDGNYGIFVTFFLKHYQAEMTTFVEPDIMFFNGCFIAINGLLNLTAMVVYLVILIDSLYTDNGLLVQKIGIFAAFSIVWCVIFPMIILSEDGFRHLIFIDFYSHRPATVLFLTSCFFCAVVFGINVAKFLFDLVNMIHYKGLQVQRMNIHIVKIVCGFNVLFMTVSIISTVFKNPFPKQGSSTWNNTVNIIVGSLFSIFPLLSVTMYAFYYMVYTGKKRGFKFFKSFRPHRDWFKNKYHIQICFPNMRASHCKTHFVYENRSDSDSSENEFKLA